MSTPHPDEAAIFNAARRIAAPEGRRAYLEQACGGDESLRARIEALLRVHEQDPGFLAAPVEDVPSSAAPGTSSEGPGTVIGPYKLLEQIGEGGFGIVFMAQQQQPVRRTVALKVLKPGLETRQVIARFEAERQALALMDHPNIANILDGGESASGRPYFVMELVKGIPINRYCDTQQLTPRERLALFLPVCQAVQHAHQKGIIHRDLKPTNVLVAAYDGKPVPKVIDFGVAKALGQKLTDRTLVTGFGSVIGTLEYMSPEQAEFNAADIDTRADVYSLGVLLYELLTGTTPLTKEQMQQSALTEVLRLIREKDPPKPSARLSESKETLASISAQRKLEPARLHKQVRGELDWIVMKALEKDRNRRYATANGLARDIENYLNEEPVGAGPPSAVYRLRKFVRKHRMLLGVAAAFVLLLAAATVVSGWLAYKARLAEKAASHERDKALAEKERADEETAIAQSVKYFLEKDLLAQANPEHQTRADQRPDANLTVRTLLDRAAARISGQFDAQPLVEADIRNTLAVTYAALGQHAQAEGHARRARDLYLATLGPEDIRTVRATYNLGNECFYQGRSEEARRIYADMLEIARRVFGPDSKETLGLMNNLANALRDLHQLDEARRLHEETLEARRRVFGLKDRGTLQSMNNLAFVLRLQGRLEEARRMHEETWRLQQEVLQPDHPQTLGSMHNLALVLSLQGHREESAKLYEELIARQERALGPQHPARLDVMNSLAWLLAVPSDPRKGNPRRAQELAKAVVQHAPRQADKWNTLALANYRAGDWKEAIAAAEQSEKLSHGEMLGFNGLFLAMAHWQLGAKEAARQWYDKAVPANEKTPPTDAELLQFRAEATQLLGIPPSRLRP
jgi:serine/threonine protein kinase/TolA-binding protein